MKIIYNYIVVQMSQFDGEILSEKEFDTVNQVSKFLKVHRNTVNNYIKRGCFGGKYEDYNAIVKIKRLKL